MLSKLAFRNVKRSAKDYVIYLITVTLAFSFIFAFNLMGNSKEILNLCDVMNNFALVMYFVNAFIIVVVCFLINYTVKFMFSKRSKEFGTYMLLGIKKKKITKMFTFENIILGFFSLLISIPIGYIFSLFMSFIVTRMFELDSIVKITFNLNSVLLLLLYFALIYLFVLFLARHRIKKVKIHDLLYLEKQNEEKRFKKNKVRNVAFIVSLIVGVVAMFLFDKQFKGMGTEPSFGIIFLCILLIIISIYGVAITLSDFILKIVLKNKKIKYSKDNLFIARTFSSKVKTMSFTLGTLTVLITFTLIALNLSSLFKGMFDYQLEYSAPYDISIHADEEDIPEYLKIIEDNYTIEDKLIYNGYSEPNNNIGKLLNEERGWRETDQVIKLSDYNKLLELKGDKKVTLKDDEYLLHITKELKDNLEDKKEISYITLANGKTLKQKEIKSEGYTYAWGMGYGFVIVVPDEAVDGLTIEETRLIVNTKEETTEKFAKELTSYIAPDICEETIDGETVCYSLANITIRGQEKANNNGFVTITSFVCFYIAFIFIAVVGTILAIQSLSDSTKYKYRYRVLSKLGVRDEVLNKTIFKQLFVFFIFPIFYPLIISFVTVTSLNKIFNIVLTTDTIYLLYYFINVFIFVLIYAIYFLVTYFGFKRNIEKN